VLFGSKYASTMKMSELARERGCCSHLNCSIAEPEIHLYQKCAVPPDVPTSPDTRAMKRERARIHNARTRTAHPVMPEC
jgi:hypothetical protein